MNKNSYDTIFVKLQNIYCRTVSVLCFFTTSPGPLNVFYRYIKKVRRTHTTSDEYIPEPQINALELFLEGHFYYTYVYVVCNRSHKAKREYFTTFCCCCG